MTLGAEVPVRRLAVPRMAVRNEQRSHWSGDHDWAERAVVDGGGCVVPPEEADGLVWLGGPAGLAEVLRRGPDIRWVQLPSAGIDRFRDVLDPSRTWTCGKGMASSIVAEHALALVLAGQRRLVTYARASDWCEVPDQPLRDSHVLVVGGGGIAEALLGMLRPFDVRTTIVRRRPRPTRGADRVVGTEQLLAVLPDADVVVLALALTPETTGVIGARELAAMRPHAWLVNVSRGAHVVTDDLVRVLAAGTIGGAALDVTDPEPLPAGHPLWSLPNCLVTPHVATTPRHSRAWLERRIAQNVGRFARGEELVGLVDPVLGY